MRSIHEIRWANVREQLSVATLLGAAERDDNRREANVGGRDVRHARATHLQRHAK